MIKNFNSVRPDENYVLNKENILMGALACALIGSMIVGLVGEEAEPITEEININDIKDENCYDEYGNVAVYRTIIDNDWKNYVIDINNGDYVQFDSVLKDDVDGLEYLWVSQGNKQAIINPNAEKPLADVTLEYDFVGGVERVGNDLVTVAWNFYDLEDDFRMEYALLNCTTGDTLILPNTYDDIKINHELNGVWVYDKENRDSNGVNYPSALIPFSELGLSTGEKINIK